MENKKNSVPAHAETKAIKILAKSVFKNLQADGFGECQIVAFATEVLGLLSSTQEPEGEAG